MNENNHEQQRPQLNIDWQVLKDDSPMPYGKYKGAAMVNVPADYLMWLWDNDKADKSVRAYIKDNWDVLCKQTGRPAGGGVFGKAVPPASNNGNFKIDTRRNAQGFRDRVLPYKNRKLGG